jgi:hypothetical protein
MSVHAVFVHIGPRAVLTSYAAPLASSLPQANMQVRTGFSQFTDLRFRAEETISAGEEVCGIDAGGSLRVHLQVGAS